MMNRSPAPFCVTWETLLEECIAKAKSEHVSLVHSTFGLGDHLDVVAIVARFASPHYSPGDIGHEMALCADVFGWSHSQLWAFLAGYDLDPAGPFLAADSRAKAHPELVQLGQRIRHRHFGGIRS